MPMKFFSITFTAFFFLAVITSSFFYWGKSYQPNPYKNEYQLIVKPCWFKTDWRKTVKCFHLKTSATSGEFYLPVVVIKYEAEDHRNDPVIYLQGGPGAGADLTQEGIERWLDWFALADLKRDLILMDPRGTGRSLPKLNCDDNGQQIRIWKQNLSLKEELVLSNQSMLKCLEDLRKKNINLNAINFSTQDSARDILQLIRKLKYKEWNILAVSYGTRLALEIERQNQLYGSGLKTAVLDSIYPAGYGGVQTWPEVLHDAVEKFLTGCPEQKSCAELIGDMDLRESFTDALDYLQKSPVSMTLKRWNGEVPINFVVNDHRFMSAVFAAIYDPRTWPNIVVAIQSIRQRSAYQMEVDIKKLMEPYLNRNLNEDFNSLAFSAVDCADNQIGSEAVYLQSVDQYPLLAVYTRDQWYNQLCHDLKNDKLLVLTSPSIPVLILSGRHDPITPVSWAESVHQQWPSSQLIIRDDLSHSVLSTDVCLLQNLYRYFDDQNENFEFCDAK